MFNVETGEDDEHPLGGDIGVQDSAPVIPMPPPPSQAPGPEAMPSMPAPTPAAVPTPNVLSAPATPGLPDISPYQPAPLPPIPSSRVVNPAEAGTLNAQEANAAARMRTAQDQGTVNTAKATANDQSAERSQFVAEAFQQERKRIADEATKRIQERQAQANADYDAFKKFGIKDPEAGQGFATSILKAIAVGLGQYAQGINGGSNTALNIIQERNKDNIARQKAQQEKLYQVAQKSGKDVEQAKEDRDDAFRQLDLKHAALLDSSAGMLRSELARLGIPQAQIDANKDVQTIEKESLGIREKALQDIGDREVALAKADISAAGRKARHAAGGGEGAARGDAQSQLAEAVAGGMPYPDQIKLAAKLGIPTTAKSGQVSLESIRKSVQSGVKGEDLHQRAGDRQEAMNVTSTTGEELGKAHSPQDAQKLRSANIAFDQLKTRIQALIDDVRKNPRATDDESMARRDSLAAAVAAAGRVYNQLGVSNANVQLEKQMMGPTGSISHGVIDLIRGGKADVLEHMLEEAETRHNSQLSTYLRKAPAAAPTAPTPASGGGGKKLEIKTATDKALAATARRLKPGDPNYESAQMWLRAHGE
jgi:hypothetical protein